MTSLMPIPVETQNYLDTIWDIDMEASINQIYEKTTMCHAQIDILKEVMSNNSLHPDKLSITALALKTLENHIMSLEEDLNIFKFEFIGSTS